MDKKTIQIQRGEALKSNDVRINGRVLELGTTKIDLNQLEALLQKTSFGRYARAVKEQNRCIAQLMAAQINDFSEPTHIAPTAVDIELLHSFSDLLGRLEV